MNKNISTMLAVLLVTSMALAACGGGGGGGQLFCQVTDTGGIDDKSFNATVWKGFEDAEADLGVEVNYVESQQQTDYTPNINAFIEEGCEVIFTVGFLMGAETYAAVAENPDQNFVWVDGTNTDPPSDNMAGMVFATDEGAFLAGYVAAGSTQTGKVGVYGGIQIPTVTDYMDGFWYGVQYYNQQNGTNVEVVGWDPSTQTGSFTGNFESTDDGRALGESMMDEGVDIILPVAGPVGLGTAAAAQERGNAWVIGVDADWTLTSPEYADVVLTSILKNMDVASYDIISATLDGNFPGGTDFKGNLENGGVGLAGVENFSADLQADLETIADGIVAGEIQTKP